MMMVLLDFDISIHGDLDVFEPDLHFFSVVVCRFTSISTILQILSRRTVFFDFEINSFAKILETVPESEITSF